ncbi:MAG: hypothetical protein RIF41_13520, partial [Polyangiaceae bacterium]
MKLRAMVSTLVLLALLSWSRPAAAGNLIDDFFDAIAIGFIVVAGVGGILITDVVFTAHDASVYGDDERPTTGWAVGETLVTAPQAMLLDAGMAVLGTEDFDDDEVLEVLFYPPAIWLNTLAVHGTWSWAALDREPDPGALYGVSWLIGVNVPATTYATARLVQGLPARTPMAIAMMATTIPGVVVPAHQLATSDRATPGWVALTAWSGLLFTYGASSVVVNAVDAGASSGSETGHLPFGVLPHFTEDIRGERAPGLA